MEIWWTGSLCSDVSRGFNLNIRISSSSPLPPPLLPRPGIDWIKASALYLNTDVCNSFIKDISRALLWARSETSMSISRILLCSQLTDCRSPLGLCLGVPGHRENTQLEEPCCKRCWVLCEEVSYRSDPRVSRDGHGRVWEEWLGIITVSRLD